MEKVNAAYETLFIVDLSLGDDGVRAMTDRFLAMIAEAGEITETSEWGKRRLAYPINDLNEGYYVLVNYNAPAEFPAELERVFNITEGIMRSMTIRLGE
jgi:small subunit ribosomal protein S6